MEKLLLPSRIEYREGRHANHGIVVITPCYHGYGTTLGNGLRRVLLSSLPGAAVEGFKVKGVQHEFSAVPAVKEDVVEILLNLKQLAVKSHSDEPVVLNLVKKGPGKATAKDIEKNASVEIFNKDLALFEVTENKTVEMEIIVGRGRGFKPAEEKDRKNYDLGTIVIDSIYTPVRDVGYKVEYTRVGDITNYEELTLDIETNGTISPKDAVIESTKILMDHFTAVLESLSLDNLMVERAQAGEQPDVSEAAETEAEEPETDSAAAEEPAEKPKTKKKTAAKTAKKSAKKK